MVVAPLGRSFNHRATAQASSARTAGLSAVATMAVDVQPRRPYQLLGVVQVLAYGQAGLGKTCTVGKG